MYGQSCPAGTLRVVFVSEGRTEKGHHATYQELIYCPFEPVDFIQQKAKTPVHDLMNGLGIEISKNSAGIGHIDEHDGDDFALAFYGATRCQDLVCQIFGCVGAGTVEIQGFGFSGRSAVFDNPPVY